MDNKFFTYGCMFSGKTSKIQCLIKRCPKPFVVIVHKLQNKCTTHDGIVYEDFVLCESFEEIVKAGAGAKVWFIDEVQFFTAECVAELLKRPEIIYFGGLNTDFNGDYFATSDLLIKKLPFENQSFMSSICKCGLQAIHSKLKVKKPEKNILIGGSDLYEPVCRKCFYLC